MKHHQILYWFRNDLRLSDNEALFRSVNQAENIFPVYIFDIREFQPTALGFTKTGAFRAKFLTESVRDLKEKLQEQGGDLIVRVGHPEEIIPNLAHSLGVNKVISSKEITTEEVELESILEKKLWSLKIEFDLVWQSTLFHVDDIPWPIKNLPDVFTHFRKESEKVVQVRSLIPTPQQIPIRADADIDWGSIPSIEDLGIDPKPVDERMSFHFLGGEERGLERLKYYLWDSNCICSYKETRNGLLGADYSSKFSPWLSLGCISPRQIYDEVKRYESERKKNQSTYWMVFELLWRDYFRFVAKKYGSRIFRVTGIKGEPIDYTENLNLFEKWQSGSTGIPFIDANMRELNATGFMSNRGRQNVASFLVKDLKVNWTWGASYFEHLLIDYDPCSNWGNWNYMAGVGNDPREDRYFNIMSQAKRYDPQGKYVKHWLPELNAMPSNKVHHPAIYLPKELSGYQVRLGADYPKPIVPFKKWVY
jgi:deoxyribodipyrimidine photo-lyase